MPHEGVFGRMRTAGIGRPHPANETPSVRQEKPEKHLNLIGVVTPISLLECKRALEQMATGAELEVLISDAVMVDTLVKIVRRSADRLVQCDRLGDHFLIRLKKGERSIGGP